jgi:hypothetical protein
MKKHITLFSFIALFLLSAAGVAQTQKAAAHTAQTSYDQASLDNALKAKTFEFSLANLSADEAAKLEKTAVPYTKIFSVNISSANSTHTCKVDFKNDTQMKIVYRYFIANNISEIIYKGEKVTAESFFKQWM